MHASLVAPHETTPRLAKMCPETVKGDPEAGDMEDMADKKTLAVERDNSRAPAQDRSKGIVTHADAEALHGLV